MHETYKTHEMLKCKNNKRIYGYQKKAIIIPENQCVTRISRNARRNPSKYPFVAASIGSMFLSTFNAEQREGKNISFGRNLLACSPGRN